MTISEFFFPFFTSKYIEGKPNRKHKDSVFTKLFGEKSNLLELYNAVSGKNYPESPIWVL